MAVVFKDSVILIRSGTNDETSTLTAFHMPSGSESASSDSSQFSRILSRDYSHPNVHSFIDPASEEDISWANYAYNEALRNLRSCLTSEDISKLTTSCSLQQVEEFAKHAQRRWEKGRVMSKVRKLLIVLHNYSQVLDILCQSHPELACLIWGSIRWLLQACMNYMRLLERLSDMLAHIGRSIPRIELYRRILPTSRIMRAASELYAAILDFLHPAIVFFRKRLLRRFVSALCSPLETGYEESINRIHQLQENLERDALAVGLAHQQMDNVSLTRQMAEMTTCMDGMLQKVEDLTEISTASLLLYIRDDLFRNHEEDAIYHERIIDCYKISRSEGDWEPWFFEEQRYYRWSYRNQSTITHGITETNNPQMYLYYVEYARRTAPEVVFACMLWGEGMTARTAIASIIFQMLVQRPETLYKRSSAFYLRKFSTANSSFHSLWNVFLELVRTLPGLLLLASIGSAGSEECIFVKKLMELFDYWDGPPINLALFHPGHLPLEAKHQHCTVDLDDKFDISPCLENSDALHQIVLYYIGFHDILSNRIRNYQWGSLWRTTRYSTIAIALQDFLETARQMAAASADVEHRGRLLEDLNTASSRRQFKRFVLKQVYRVPLNIPPETQERLQYAAVDIISRRLSAARAVHRGQLPEDPKDWIVRPFEVQTQEVLFYDMQLLIKHACAKWISEPTLAHLKHALDNSVAVSTSTSSSSGNLESIISLHSAAEFLPVPEKLFLTNAGNALQEAVEAAICVGLEAAVEAVIENHLACNAPRVRTCASGD